MSKRILLEYVLDDKQFDDLQNICKYKKTTMSEYTYDSLIKQIQEFKKDLYKKNNK